MVLTFIDFASGANFVSDVTQEPIYTQAVQAIPFSFELLFIVIVLIAITIFIMFFLKKLIVNSIVGGIIWFLAVFVFKVNLPLIPSFVVSVIFGPAGIGTLLLLSALGLLVI